MKDEYLIINKTKLEEKLKKNDNQISFLQKMAKDQKGNVLQITQIAIGKLYAENDLINNLLHQSTPLIPVVEQAFESGVDSLQDNLIQKLGLHYQTSEISSTTANSTRGDLQQYIENLKLKI